MESSKLNQGFRGDDGNSNKDDSDESSHQESKSNKNTNSSLNYDKILDEIGQFGR